jgi:hypothetical protein
MSLVLALQTLHLLCRCCLGLLFFLFLVGVNCAALVPELGSPSLPIGTGENITSAGRRLVTESYARISHSMYRHSCSSSLLVAMVLLVVVDGLSEILLPRTEKMFGFHSPVLHAVSSGQSDLSKIRKQLLFNK